MSTILYPPLLVVVAIALIGVVARDSDRCGNYYTKSSGVVTAPNYSTSYSCSYTFRMSFFTIFIHFKWKEFNIGGSDMPDCINDRVEIYTG